MSSYNIERWDAVIKGTESTKKSPMIYIKPDITFLDFSGRNNFVVHCVINGTGTIYDGKLIEGLVDKSSNSHNKRHNFYKKTGLYVITLLSNWHGYPDPDKLGTVKFYGLKASSDDNHDNEENNSLSQEKNVKSESETPSSTTLIIIVIALVLVFFGGIAIVHYKYKDEDY